MKRYFKTERFSSPQFRVLSPFAKLTLLAIESECDAAGFWTYDAEEIAALCGIPAGDVGPCFRELVDAGFAKATKEHVWLPHFLEDQGVARINPSNNAHKAIRRALEPMLHHFPAAQAQLGAAAPEPAPAPNRLSLHELRNAPKDWDEIKQRCMGHAQGCGFAMQPIREALEAWWDHAMTRGNPYELPMWRVLVDDVKAYGPEVAIEAIRFARASNLGHLNFLAAKNFVDQRNRAHTISQDGTKPRPSDTPELSNWKRLFKNMFPNAQVDYRDWFNVPRPIQIQLEQAAATGSWL